MPKWIKTVGIIVAVVLLVAQVYRPERSNPQVDPQRGIHAILSVDPTVTTVFNRACRDCHSNQTVWPWYTSVAPASWLVVSDVRRGRTAMNLSEWGNYTPQQQQKHLKAICSEVTEGEMPALQYIWMHRDAVLNPAEKAAVCQWTRAQAGAAFEPRVED